MTITIDDIPEPAASASLRLRDELVSILGPDLVSAWLYGGTTFQPRPGPLGDIDICAVIANAAPDERSPRNWRADPSSRPARIFAAQDAIARDLGVHFDTIYLPAEEVGRARLPSMAFRQSGPETGWAVYRAHWLSGQYVPLYGRPPEQLVIPPTTAQIRRALDRELAHLERHVEAGDASDPYEATYAILNGCRILYTLETGSPVISKHAAGGWGLEHLAERWHDVLRAAGRSYEGAATAEDVDVLRVTMPPFVEMVRQRLPGSTPRIWGRPDD